MNRFLKFPCTRENIKSPSSTQKFRLLTQTCVHVRISPPRIPTGGLHGNHSLTPITMETGINITHFFFYWPISSLSDTSVPCASPRHSFQLLPFLKWTLCADVRSPFPLRKINRLILPLSMTNQCVTVISDWLCCSMWHICGAGRHGLSVLKWHTDSLNAICDGCVEVPGISSKSLNDIKLICCVCHGHGV